MAPPGCRCRSGAVRPAWSWPIPQPGCMAPEGMLGLVRTVPPGMEPSSACACMSVLGYDPKVYYRGRAAIEARSLGIPVGEGEVVFRCNLVAVRRRQDVGLQRRAYQHRGGAGAYCGALNEKLGSDEVQFLPRRQLPAHPETKGT